MPTPSLLLVEDSEDDILFMRRALKEAQVTHPVHVVEDGDAAVAFLEEAVTPLLVLLDLKLPRRSGLEVLAWMREQPRLRTVPVIVFTSSTEPADLDRAYGLHANAYVAKPAERKLLVQFVQALKSFWLSFNEFPR